MDFIHLQHSGILLCLSFSYHLVLVSLSSVYCAQIDFCMEFNLMTVESARLRALEMNFFS